jgi:hypothetical protein
MAGRDVPQHAVMMTPVKESFDDSRTRLLSHSTREVIAIKHDTKRLDILKATAVPLAMMGIAGAVEKSAWAEIATQYNDAPKPRNVPIGKARGIDPGRVVWVRDPKAAHWGGDRVSVSDQWWMDKSTGQAGVDAMVSLLLLHVTGAESDSQAWKALFRYDGRRNGVAQQSAYRPGEIVAVKVNLNNSKPVVPTNLVNGAPVKAHSYPYAAAEGGDEGQTGVTLTGKNHRGSIKGPGQLHSIINTNQTPTRMARLKPILRSSICLHR